MSCEIGFSWRTFHKPRLVQTSGGLPAPCQPSVRPQPHLLRPICVVPGRLAGCRMLGAAACSHQGASTCDLSWFWALDAVTCDLSWFCALETVPTLCYEAHSGIVSTLTVTRCKRTLKRAPPDWAAWVWVSSLAERQIKTDNSQHNSHPA